MSTVPSLKLMLEALLARTHDHAAASDASKRAPVALLARLSPRRRWLAKWRAQWGQPGAKERFNRAGYHDLLPAPARAGDVDAQTWADLEFPAILDRMDTTVTPLGSQLLYALLHHPVDPATHAARYAEYKAIAGDAALRETLQWRLQPLADDANTYLADLLLGERDEAGMPSHGVTLWSLVCVALFVAVLSLHAPFWIWLLVLPVNAVILYRAAGHMFRDRHALRNVPILIGVADALGRLARHHPELSQLVALRDEAPARADVRRILRWNAWWSRLCGLQIIGSACVALNFAFLIDLVLYARTSARFHATRKRLHASFRRVGELDALIAVASFLALQPDHCEARVDERLALDITAARHPLLPQGVRNSIRLDGRSALVTGSNMAGKTTFIKTLAINTILGRTLGFCFAEVATLPAARVLASIHGLHSVDSGKSHYFAEIEAFDRFIAIANAGTPCLIAIDEPFSGTNTVERIAIARAVLEALARRAIVLVTTHDVELQAMLADHFHLYHFQENPDVEGYFDYLLRPGAARGRNAIRLLERIGFPREVTAQALRYAAPDGQGAASCDDAAPAR